MFHFLWKENLIKHEKLKKIMENMVCKISATIVKNSQIKAKISFSFLKNVLKQMWKSFNNQYRPQQKIGMEVTN